MMGPQCRISCLSMASKKIDILAAGCSDKRIRVHDTRLESPAVVLKGLAAVPCSLQVHSFIQFFIFRFIMFILLAKNGRDV